MNPPRAVVGLFSVSALTTIYRRYQKAYLTKEANSSEIVFVYCLKFWNSF